SRADRVAHALTYGHPFYKDAVHLGDEVPTGKAEERVVEALAVHISGAGHESPDPGALRRDLDDVGPQRVDGVEPGELARGPRRESQDRSQEREKNSRHHGLYPQPRPSGVGSGPGSGNGAGGAGAPRKRYPRMRTASEMSTFPSSSVSAAARQ